MKLTVPEIRKCLAYLPREQILQHIANLEETRAIARKSKDSVSVDAIDDCIEEMQVQVQLLDREQQKAEAADKPAPPPGSPTPAPPSVKPPAAVQAEKKAKDELDKVFRAANVGYNAMVAVLKKSKIKMFSENPAENPDAIDYPSALRQACVRLASRSILPDASAVHGVFRQVIEAKDDWTFGHTFDERTKKHPWLCGFADLPEPVQAAFLVFTDHASTVLGLESTPEDADPGRRAAPVLEPEVDEEAEKEARAIASDAALRLADENGVMLSQVPTDGTTITVRNVERYLNVSKKRTGK